MGVLLRGDGGGRVPGVCVVGVVCGVGGWGGDGRHMEVETGGAVCIEFGGVPVGEGGGRHPGYHGVHAEGYAENLAHGGVEGGGGGELLMPRGCVCCGGTAGPRRIGCPHDAHD